MPLGDHGRMVGGSNRLKRSGSALCPFTDPVDYSLLKSSPVLSRIKVGIRNWRSNVGNTSHIKGKQPKTSRQSFRDNQPEGLFDRRMNQRVASVHFFHQASVSSLPMYLR